MYSLDFSSFREHAEGDWASCVEALDPSQIPLIMLFSFMGSVMSQTRHSTSRASLWLLVIYLGKQQIE